MVGGVAGAAIISAGVWLILHHLRNSGECEEMLEKDATDAHPGVYGVFHDQRQLSELANVECGVAEMDADSGVEVMSQELAELPLR